MMTNVLRSLAVFAATTTLAACGGKSAPEPAEPAAAAEPAAQEPAGGEAGGAAPAEPAPDPEKVKAELLDAEKSAYELAQPVLEKHCAKCHSKASKKAKKASLEHFDMTSYPFGGEHADDMATAIREVLAIGDGKKATMPKDHPGAVAGAELSLIADWADAYDKAKAGGAHEGAEHAEGEHAH